ncbi:hypothetical protein V2K16_01950 [Pseudomonas alliivorans]|uniref:hypothetical protein n=1 Tax=Pseudomonas alliivorans TaxID=2810613 RepID=UPI001AE34AF1|nr:hypothetical protein [Pseudomonas alliivorans]MBP0938979.1 hypothetical protein [Pseudomonas alliivorans]MEE4878040.1 hypothetical protein [Pseudomonas alliivorans]MEE4928417.1 hypothetical protein [Pseudomonas alliivorans]MEE4933832.1 hypothetical protein [Pseudomonas alliivorans]MEE4938964.1 hypothetical protein [Pseudomonas alliivorans]
MTPYELFTLLVSVVAIIISAVTLVRTRKLASEQLALERITAELSGLQIKTLEESEKLKTKPQLNIALTKLGGSNHFIVSNTGRGSAFKVNFELIDCSHSPLSSDVDHILPYPEMKPNSRFKLLASMHMGSPLKYQVKLTWQEVSGDNISEIHWCLGEII